MLVFIDLVRPVTASRSMARSGSSGGTVQQFGRVFTCIQQRGLRVCRINTVKSRSGFEEAGN